MMYYLYRQEKHILNPAFVAEFFIYEEEKINGRRKSNGGNRALPR
ncbi:hypothetical protein ECDEC6D_5203 [Escherichia coli DEC6D]|nr:hypothetical protein ECDEC6D_5203 [Escherichia coli DEC6D]